MQRDPNGEIIFERLNTFEPISHRISIQNNIETNWECIYEHVRVFTDANNPIIALNFCRHGRLNCYDLTQDTPTTRTILKDDHIHIQEQRAIINRQFNAYQNCLGFCVLDGKFWINILPENLNTILNDDNYIEVQNCLEDHFIIYYQDNLPIHISKYNSVSNQFQHKIGCNSHHVTPTNDVSGIYIYNTIRLFTKAILP